MDGQTARERLEKGSADATREVLVERLTASAHTLGMPEPAGLIALGLLYVGDRLATAFDPDSIQGAIARGMWEGRS